MIGGLPAKAAELACEWPAVRQIRRVQRWRWQKVNGKWRAPQDERRKRKTVDPVTSLTAAVSPQDLPSVNRNHWGIEIMQRNKDVIPGEDSYTNRGDDAPRYVFSHDRAALVLDKIQNRFPWLTTLIVM